VEASVEIVEKVFNAFETMTVVISAVVKAQRNLSEVEFDRRR